MMNIKYLLSIATVLFLCSTIMAQDEKWTLKVAVAYAIDNNISIQQAKLNIDDATYQRQSAFGSFLPTANATVSQAWNIGLNSDVTSGVLVNQTNANTSIGINVGVNIFNGFQNKTRLQKADLTILAQQYQLDDMKDNISLLVANSFLQILFNKESLKVLQTQYVVTQQDIERTKELIKSGVLPQGDLLALEATLASQEQQIVNTKNNIRLSKISLAQLLLITDYENFDVATDEYSIPTSEVSSATPNDIYLKALTVRNKIKIAQSNVALAEKDYEIAKGGVYPTLSGFYSFNTRASDRERVIGSEVNSADPTREIGFVENTTQKVLVPNTIPITSSATSLFDQFDTNKGHSFGLQLRVPIFNGYSNKMSQASNKLNVERAKLNYEQAKIDLASRVNQAYSDTQGALKTYHAAEKTKIARQQAFDYARERHEVGVINSFAFQQTKQLLTSAEAEVVRAKYDYIFKIKVLEFYFGVPLAEK